MKLNCLNTKLSNYKIEHQLYSLKYSKYYKFQQIIIRNIYDTCTKCNIEIYKGNL